jgi:hypothetical protein
MSHPAIKNNTAFVLEPLFLVDEDGSPLFIPVVKATYKIHEKLERAIPEEHVPVKTGGEYWGDPDFSSYKYEPETAFIKPATDVVLIGHAHAQKPGATSVDVGLRVGPVQKVVRVVGDRLLMRRSGRVSVYGPKPFEKIPLVYERAFGGWDRRHTNPDKHKFEPRNPVGVGFGYPDGKTEEPIQLPNIEDPKRPWKRWGDRPPPAGFGFISPHWQPRASFAGTYDKKWDETRKPLLPTDFDRRFFNAASPGLIAPGYLLGNEAVVMVNASPGGRISFNLPGVPPPWCAVELRGGKEEVLQTQLDTVIINTDENLIFLLWRAHMVVRNGPQDVLAIEIDTKPRATETEAA